MIISWAKVDRATRKDPLFQRIVRRQDDMNPPYIFLLFGVEAKLLFTSHSWPQWGGADLIGFLDEVARPVPVDTWSYHATFISTISCRSLPPLYLCIDVCSFFYIFDKFKSFLKKNEFIHPAVPLVEKFCVVLVIFFKS